jgi:hypothetical protein
MPFLLHNRAFYAESLEVVSHEEAGYSIERFSLNGKVSVQSSSAF